MFRIEMSVVFWKMALFRRQEDPEVKEEIEGARQGHGTREKHAARRAGKK
jgi:hypothetical protein